MNKSEKDCIQYFITNIFIFIWLINNQYKYIHFDTAYIHEHHRVDYDFEINNKQDILLETYIDQLYIFQFCVKKGKYLWNTSRPQPPPNSNRYGFFVDSKYTFYENRYFFVAYLTTCGRYFRPKWPKVTSTDQDISFEPITKSL